MAISTGNVEYNKWRANLSLLFMWAGGLDTARDKFCGIWVQTVAMVSLKQEE